jgi:hypothetical protein
MVDLRRWQPRIVREPDKRQGDLFALSSDAMPTLDLDDDELAAVIAALKEKLDRDHFPRAPRLAPLRSALAKLDPASAPRPIVPPKPPLMQAARARGTRARR